MRLCGAISNGTFRRACRRESRSRENLPNPIHTESDPYVPLNRPAIDDMTGLFDFKRKPEP
jgi:hypothetical protein